MMMRWSNCLVLLAVVAMFGCGPERPTTIGVSGKVTFNGNPPPAEGMLMFAPIEAAEGYPKRGGRATFDTSGDYVATTFEDGDGLMPGTYRVNIECWKTPPDMDNPAAGESYVAAGFERPIIEIKVDDDSRDIPIEVTLAK